jgi:type II secretory pathway component PulJ
MATMAELEKALAESLALLEKSRATCESIAAQKNAIIDQIGQEKETWRRRALVGEEQAAHASAARKAAEQTEAHARFESKERGETIKALCLERDDLKMANERLKRENAVLTAVNEKQNRWIEQYVIAGKVP